MLRAPDLAAASTTTVPIVSAAISRFLAKNAALVTLIPGAISEITRCSAFSSSKSLPLPRGYASSSPPA